MEDRLKQRLRRAQRNEITEHWVYRRLAEREKSAENAGVLRRIADEEKRHYDFCRQHTGEDVAPRRWLGLLVLAAARLFGVTFAIKVMEKGEGRAEESYAEVAERLPEARRLAEEEDEHENALMGLLDEDRLKYVGSIMLGLSDALVELTGVLAGLTLALQKGRLIAVIGLITGIAAAMSMAASEYLSTRTENHDGKSSAKASFYTGSTYFFTVLLLIAPFLLLASPIAALAATVAAAICLVAVFSFYVSFVQDQSFWRRFAEMAGLCLSVAAVSFGIGFVVRAVFGVEV